MPSVTCNGVRTRYEVEGSGPPLVLHVGFLGSLEDWGRQDRAYTDALRDKFQLILVDPRGQGQSDKPHDPTAYTLDARAGDIIAVLDELGIDRTHFWGYSMGGSVGFMLAARHQDRLRSLVVGASSPWWQPPVPEKDQLYRWLENGMEGFVAEWERAIGPLPPGTREGWLAGDADALRAARLAPGSAGTLPEELRGNPLPTLLYIGTEDNAAAPARRTAELLPNLTLVLLEGLDHAQGFRRSDLVLPHVMRFLETVELEYSRAAVNSPGTRGF